MRRPDAERAGEALKGRCEKLEGPAAVRISGNVAAKEYYTNTTTSFTVHTST
jgi:hypothetical protein